MFGFFFFHFFSDDVLEIKPVYTNYLLRIGATQELNCSVNASEQNSKLVWSIPTLDGVTREESAVSTTSKLTLRSSLRIEHFSAANAGDYKCILDRAGEQVSEAVIHLKAVKGNPSLCVVCAPCVGQFHVSSEMTTPLLVSVCISRVSSMSYNFEIC